MVTVSLLPSCEESVSIGIERWLIEKVPISLPVFVRAGRVVTSFLRGEVDGAVGGEGGEGEGVSAATRGSSELAASLTFKSLPQRGQ